MTFSRVQAPVLTVVAVHPWTGCGTSLHLKCKTKTSSHRAARRSKWAQRWEPSTQAVLVALYQQGTEAVFSLESTIVYRILQLLWCLRSQGTGRILLLKYFSPVLWVQKSKQLCFRVTGMFGNWLEAHFTNKETEAKLLVFCLKSQKQILIITSTGPSLSWTQKHNYYVKYFMVGW